MSKRQKTSYKKTGMKKSKSNKNPKISWEKSIKSAFWRTTSFLSILVPLYCIYIFNSFYQEHMFKSFQSIIDFLFIAFIIGSFIYYVLRVRYFYKISDELTCTPIIVMIYYRRIYRRLAKIDPPEKKIINKRIKTKFLNILVKAFFLPLMVTFFNHHYNGIRKLGKFIMNHGNLDFIDMFNKIQSFALHCIFMLDTLIATCGYAIESRIFDNKTKSVDPSFFGWFVALICYPPFNSLTSSSIGLSTDSNFTLIPEEYVYIHMTLKVCIFILFIIYVWATVALGLRFSNLSNKGIIDTGPYRVIRHPAYISKNLAWWFEYLPYMKNFHNVFPMLIWNLVYFLRGITEEWHLKRDPDYQKYCKKVKWRFIPGIF